MPAVSSLVGVSHTAAEPLGCRTRMWSRAGELKLVVWSGFHTPDSDFAAAQRVVYWPLQDERASAAAIGPVQFSAGRLRQPIETIGPALPDWADTVEEVGWRLAGA